MANSSPIDPETPQSRSDLDPMRPAPEPAAAGKKLDGEIIPPQVEAVLRQFGVNPESPDVRTAIEVSLLAWRGTLPIPPAPILVELEKVRPGITEKIIGWTEQQRGHRQGIEKMRAEGDERRKDKAQIIGAVVAGVGLICATLTGIFGNGWAAAVIATVSIGGPVAAIALATNLGIADKKPDPPKAPQVPAKAEPPKDGAA